MGLKNGRHGVETLHQQAHLIVNAEIQGTDKPLFPTLAQPIGRRVKEGRRHLNIRNAFKKSEKTILGIVILIMQPINMGRYPA